MQKLMIALLAISPVIVKDDDPKEFKPIEKEFKLIWKTQMGDASFRSNILFTDQDLYIGSNGDQFKDWYPVDKKSGVYRINRKTGRIVRHFGDGDFGDMDVNGLLLYDNKIYFGNDNEEFICSTPEGKIMWSNPTSGDVEHEPCLIQANGVNHLIYATESGEVRSVNPVNGKTNWTFYAPDFDGWKPGQNRTIFKVGAYVSNTSVFYTKPLLVDLNGDNIPDLIYKSFDGKIYAINSTNGKLIWDILNSAFDRLLVNVGDSRNPIFLFNNYTYNPSDYSYSNKMMFVSKIGKSVDSMNFEKFNWGVGLNTMQLSDGRSIVNFSDSIYVFSTKGKIMNRFERKKFTDPSTNEISEESTHHTLLGNKSFTYKGKPNCIVVMHQFSYKTDSNDGFIDIVSLEEKKVIDRLNLKQRSEMPPVITDVNMDGNPDILINCFDGNLYCYSIPTY